jgi:urease accessory protein
MMLKPTLTARDDPLACWAGGGIPVPTVHLTAGGAGPVGGDRRRLEVRVGAGSALVLGEVSPTLVLPGPHGDESGLDVDVHVAGGATLAYLPEIVIAAQQCRHRTVVRVDLDDGARLLLREEVLFGRYGEQPGMLRQRLRVTVGGRPLHDQELAVGPSALGWNGSAVTADHGCAGSLLVVDPDFRRALPAPGDGAAFMALSGSGFLVSALAADTAMLRRHLDRGLSHVVDGPAADTVHRPGPDRRQ